MTGQTPSYPASTPWRDMWPHEQAAYWQQQARKHERRAIRYRRELERCGIPTPTDSTAATDHQGDTA